VSYYVIFYDRKSKDSKRELCISQKEFNDLASARAYAKTVCSSREPRIAEPLPIEPQPCGYCGVDQCERGCLCPHCGGN